MTDTPTTEEQPKRSFIKPIKTYFGLKQGQKMTEFAAEFKELTEADKIQLADGIEDGSYNY